MANTLLTMQTNDLFPIEKFTSKSDSIFKNIPPDLRLFLESQMIDKTYRKGQPIFLEGSYSAGIFYLKEGLVKKYKTDHSGKEHILSLCSAGELLGYSALLCNEPYPDSAAAIETSRLGFIPKEVFLKATNESNDLMLGLLSSLSHEFSVMVNSVMVFAHMTVRERLALTLLILAEKFEKKDQSDLVEIVLSRADMANMVGTATETLVRLLQEFKKEGILEINAKKICILKTKTLIEMSKFY
ncbi:MAG TPA: Crp/Fnr family transcriptional regulator [Prolixibacteraceae bacterium]|nr:Crp/Fnr family transcriptional regulator [Prolixibacteraceae bacterium]